MNDRTARFWAKVNRDAPNGCWIWTASTSPNGYGQFDHTTAHRIAYELTLGPIPWGYVVDHLCRNRRCVNPDHLQPVTQSLNVRRGYAGNVAAARIKAWSQGRTYCIHGHALTAANTYSPPGQPTWRMCRRCRRERWKGQGHVD